MCEHTLGGMGGLVCCREAGHRDGHVYAGSECPDRHALTEPHGDDQ